MNLFSRIKNSISADLHGVLDEKEQKNPIAMLNQHLRRCEQEVEKVRKLIERQYLLKEEFTREYQEAVHLAEKRKHQSEIALKAEQNELYEFAHQEQQSYEERSIKLKTALEQASQHLMELESKYEEMKHKLKDMNLKRLELMGRENIARAQYKMNQVLNETDNGQSTKSSTQFAEMESYLDRLEKKVHSEYYRNTIDSKIAQLEKEMEKTESPSI